MAGGLLKPIITGVLIVAAIAVNVIPGVGQVLSAAMIATITGMGITAAIGMASEMLGAKKAGTSNTIEGRTVPINDASTPRKWVFGTTAFAYDVRFEDWTTNGTDPDEDRFHRVGIHSGHKATSIDEIWFDKDLAWTKAGGVQSQFIGGTDGQWLWVTVKELGDASPLTIPNSSKYGASNRFTGCSYSHMEFKTTYNEDDQSPFAQQFPQKFIIKGKGSVVYDPRLDSTMGGSGAQRYNDQATWSFDAGALQGENPALQLLTYLIGWRINNILVLGPGVPIDRIDVPSFIAAANACDEVVTIGAGGTEKRYRSNCIFSEADDPTFVFQTLCNAMNALLRDAGGKLSLTVMKNDLGSPILTLADGDIISDFDWLQTPPLETLYNEVRGRYTVNNGGVFDLLPYNPVTVTAADGIPRVYNLDLPAVSSISQATRLAKQQLQRNLVRGKFRCDIGPRGYILQLGDPVNLTFGPLGWANKNFRVVEITYTQQGRVSLVLQEESTAIYAWDNSDVAAVTLKAPTVYDPNNSQILKNLNKLGTLEPYGNLDSNMVKNPWLQMGGPHGTMFVALTNCTKTDETAQTPLPPGPHGATKLFVAKDNNANRVSTMAMQTKSTQMRGPNTLYIGSFVHAEFVSGANSVTFTITMKWYAGASLVRTDTATLVVPASTSSSNYQWLEMAQVPPATATGGLASISAGAHSSHRVRMIGLRVSTSQAGAEIAASIDGPTPLTVQADSSGVLQGSSPYASGNYKLMESGVQVTAGITWSVTNSAGLTTVVTAGGSALLDVTAMTAKTGTATLKAVRNGKPDRTFPVVVNREDAAPPVSPPGGGGGSATSQTSGFTAVSSGTAATISNALAPTVGSGASVSLVASITTKPSGTSVVGDWVLRFQWQKSTDGGTVWNNAGSTFDATPCSTDVEGGEGGEPTFKSNYPGSASNTQSNAATAGSTPQYRLQAWIVSGSSTNTTRVINITGQISATG